VAMGQLLLQVPDLLLQFFVGRDIIHGPLQLLTVRDALFDLYK
jgi:hypothetical protein